MAPFSRVLVANRGEIAVRILSEPARSRDRHRRRLLRGRSRCLAHACRRRGVPHRPCGSFRELSRNRAVDRDGEARTRGRGSPGYGFLAENSAFAGAVEDAGLCGSGPPPAAIELMGNKTAARTVMKAAGGADCPRDDGPRTYGERCRRDRNEIGWPIAIKASAGGGGKGLKLVRSAETYLRPSSRLSAKERRISPTRRCMSSGISLILATSRCRCSRTGTACHPPGRARVHDPATPPEACRGDAVAGRRWHAACANRSDRGRRRTGGGIPLGWARSRACSLATASISSSR